MAFDPEYVKTEFSGELLDEDETELVRQIAVDFGFVDLDTSLYGDGGKTEVLNALALLTPSQNKWVRAWISRLAEVGPGMLEVHGGDEGIHYSKPKEKGEPQTHIMQIVFQRKYPVTEASDWLGFS